MVKMKALRTLLLTVMLLVSLAPASAMASVANTPAPEISIMLFRGEGCPHCAEEQKFLAELMKRYPEIAITDLEVWKNKVNAELFKAFAAKAGLKALSVPVTVIGNQVFMGFSESNARSIERLVKALHDSPPPIPPADPSANPAPYVEESPTKVDVPLVGSLDASALSLPILTVVIGGLDSFNPCALFVLMFLLSLLVHARSRARMLIVGGTFVFFSGLVYFLFMAAWLNFFVIAGNIALITTIAGGVAVVAGAINVKDFFAFKQGVSLSIPEAAKPKLFERMRGLIKASSMASMLLGTVVLAAAANAYELLCTAGFPMVYTRVLTLHKLPWSTYYLYLVLYNVVYVIPLAVIVAIFVVSLGGRKLTETEGRLLKLLSGLMMGYLGVALIAKPDVLNSVTGAAGILALALITTGAINALFGKFHASGH